ncbi:porin [Paludibacterium denitrificans]|uniref:porin n=1 Tax=Paludibacterium denitrificans TaxID=2675226 RepID=UPI001E55B699|nr:porin [Paludibacterium denitrificans]
MADVTLYGTIEADIENGKAYNYGFSKADGKLKSGTNIDDTGSLIGFKGTEDLGNGLKAIWQVEQGLNIDGSTAYQGNAYGNTFATRDSFVGLEGGFGKVRLGKLSTNLNSDMEAPDAWLYGKGVNGLTYSSMNVLDGRLNNAIRYDSPELYGFKATLAYGFGEKNISATNDKTQPEYNVGLAYQNAGYFASFGYVAARNQLDNAGETKTANYWRLEGGYNANNLLVAAYYGKSKAYAGGSALTQYVDLVPGVLADGQQLKTTEYGVTVGYTLGAFTPKFSYGRVSDIKVDGEKQDEKINQYVVGVDYALSKRTTAYTSLGFAHHKADGLENERTFAVGVQHKF